ncbi:hypothetical protein GW17_00052625 [Ensete ventricosum]|nr:hypothetical protein GW17_00052625 [Ensete ventricosum]
MCRNLPPRHHGSRCHLYAPGAPLYVITNNNRHAGPTINEKNGGSCPSPPSPSLHHRHRSPCVGGGCPLRSATALPRGGHPCDQRRRPCWRQGWPRAETPCELATGGRPCGLAATDRACRWPPLTRGLAVVGRPLRVASHLYMQTTCMWLPLPRKQRLLFAANRCNKRVEQLYVIPSHHT